MLAMVSLQMDNTYMSKNEVHVSSLYDLGEMPTPSFLHDEEGIKLANESDASYKAAYDEPPLTPLEEETLFIRSLELRLSQLDADIAALQAKRRELLMMQAILDEDQAI